MVIRSLFIPAASLKQNSDQNRSISKENFRICTTKPVQNPIIRKVSQHHRSDLLQEKSKEISISNLYRKWQTYSIVLLSEYRHNIL
jgi:hypothetical protein